MLILSKRPRNGLNGETWSQTIDTALRTAGHRILWRRALRLSARSLPILLVGIAAYIAILRFTLVDLPTWPVLLIFVPWLLLIWAWTWTQKITSAEAARYLDHALTLDERVSTSVELLNSAKLVRSHAPRTVVHNALLVDTAEALDERLTYLPGQFRFRWTRANALAVAVGVVALLTAISVPTSVALVRGERSALTRALQDQLVQVQALRSELESNQQISRDLRASILAELDTLERKLQSSSVDQASGIATLADAEQQLRAMLHTPPADFDGLVAAAQIVWTSAAADTEWDLEGAVSATDLGRASEASIYLSGVLEGMDPDVERRIAFSLERASNQASGRDAELSKVLAEASTGVRTRDHPPASRALADASRKFAEANGLREDAVALENVLAQLNKGREQIAQAGRPQTKKSQVGFRRRGQTGDASTPTPDLENFGPDSTAQQNGDASQTGLSNVSGMGPVIGQSNVASYSGSPSSSGSGGGKPAQTDGQDGTTSPGSGPGGGTGGQDGGQAGGNQQTSSGGSAGGSASDSGEQGTLSGSINGPVGGSGGAISRVSNPSGQGNATEGSTSTLGDSGDTSNGGGEQVYVPGNQATEHSDTAGGETDGTTDAGASEDPQTDGVGGRVGEGENTNSQVSSSRGPGSAVRVQTPYKEVIAEYSRQATEAIDHAYVPPDAKEYVKEYFSELGK